MRESDAVEYARRALGAQLAACRRAAGYSQAGLAEVVGYSRSTVANVETGRQHVPLGFWKSADEAVHAEGALVRVNDEVEAAVKGSAAKPLAACAHSALSEDGGAGTAGQLAHTPGDAVEARRVMGMAGWT